jgi:murein L,D-transpeptidase YcbB/YkuD
VKIRRRPGKALILALFSVSLAGCGNKPGVQPKQVEASALQSEVHDPQVRAFYEARQWQPAWDGKSEQALLAIIQQAPTNGLKPDLFLKPALPTDANAREAALTNLALRYASALARGYSDPKKLGAIYTIPRPNPNVAQGLASALERRELEQWYASLPPQTDEYRALSQAHLQYLRLAGQANASPIAEGKAIKPGHRDPRIPAVVAALRASGYLPPPAPEQRQSQGPSRYTSPLVAAIKAVQADYGMKPDGIVGRDTLDALNSGAAGRARQLAIAMERLRWLERDPPATRIDVNTAATTLDYWRGGQHVDSRRVVAGEPDKQTPQIQAAFSQLVANPYWRIPDSIYKAELANKGSGYLARNHMTFRNGRLVQLPGPKNSLGLVKFDVEDPQDIYLHDTPAKALFALPERHRSHGCVRVENALQFAAMLADQDGVFDKLQRAFASKDESYVKLRTTVPVRLFYHTAFWDGSRVQFRPDVYGWDDDVAMALGLVRGGPRKTYQARGEDLGP